MKVPPVAVDGAIRTLLAGAMLFPYGARVRLGGLAVRRLLTPFTDYRERIRSNLQMVFSHLSSRERSQIVEGCLDNCGRFLVEIYSSNDFFEQAARARITGPGMEVLLQAHREGRAVLLATAHIGNFEAARARLICQVLEWMTDYADSVPLQRRTQIASGLVIGGIYRPPSNGYFDKHYKAAYESTGGPVFAKGFSGTRGLARCMESGGWAVVLNDQHERSGPEMSFLDWPAKTSINPARMAIRYDALLVPFYGIRRPNGLDFDIIVEDAIPEGDAREMTKRLNASFEAKVRQHPEQWLWIHRRWKTTPDRSGIPVDQPC